MKEKIIYTFFTLLLQLNAFSQSDSVYVSKIDNYKKWVDSLKFTLSSEMGSYATSRSGKYKSYSNFVTIDQSTDSIIYRIVYSDNKKWNLVESFYFKDNSLVFGSILINSDNQPQTMLFLSECYFLNNSLIKENCSKGSNKYRRKFNHKYILKEANKKIFEFIKKSHIPMNDRK